MQLTKNKLRQIIKEELGRVLSEQTVIGDPQRDRYDLASMHMSPLLNDSLKKVASVDRGEGLYVEGLWTLDNEIEGALAPGLQPIDTAVTSSRPVIHVKIVMKHPPGTKYEGESTAPLYARAKIDESRFKVSPKSEAALMQALEEFNGQNNGLGGVVKYNGDYQNKITAGDGSDFPEGSIVGFISYRVA